MSNGKPDLEKIDLVNLISFRNYQWCKLHKTLHGCDEYEARTHLHFCFVCTFSRKKRFKLADKIYVTYTNLLLLKSRHGVDVDPNCCCTLKKTDKFTMIIALFPAKAVRVVQDYAWGRPEEREMASYLAEYSLNHVAPSFLPRGLTNRSNWCFVNAILQALLACPPFYNLMKNLPSVTGLKSGKSTTPMIGDS